MFTLVDERTSLSKITRFQLKKDYGNNLRIYNTNIPLAVKTAESTSHGQSIFKYYKNSKVAAAYSSFAKEVLDNDKRRTKNAVSKVR